VKVNVANLFEMIILNLLFSGSLIEITIILENALIHRKKHIQELVEAVGYIVLFLLTYSPDLNRNYYTSWWCILNRSDYTIHHY